MNFLAPRRVLRPIFRQIQPIGDWQARRVIGDRKRHRDLAIVGFAQPPAILSRDAHRVNALLGEACVINNPSLDLALSFDRRQDQFAYFVQNRFVRPSRLTHEMQQRLVFRRDARRRHHGGHRLNALALARHQQTDTIILERSHTVVTAQSR